MPSMVSHPDSDDAVIEHIEKIIQQIKDGLLEIQSISWEGHTHSKEYSFTFQVKEVEVPSKPPTHDIYGACLKCGYNTCKCWA